MSENLSSQDPGIGSSEPVGPLTLKQMMGRQTFGEYVAAIRAGLKQPKDSGEYKFAMHQVLRVWSPTAGIVLPILLMLSVMLAPQKAPPPPVDFTVTVMDHDQIEKLDDIKEIEQKPPEEIKPPDVQNFDPSSVPDEAFAGGPSAGPGAGPGPAGCTCRWS